MRTFWLGVELAAPFDGVGEQFAEGLSHALADVGGDIRLELREETGDAPGSFEFTGDQQLDPVGLGREHFDGR